jgi:serine/threonine-protein kinase RsbW
MAQAHTLAGQPRSSQLCPSVELEQSMPSETAAISPFVDQLMAFITMFREMDGSEFEIEVALREAVANAVIHGNQLDPHKRVCVSCRCSTDGEVSLTVRDEGQGFDSSTIPDPTAPENRLTARGRGIYMMRVLMDEVSFEDGGVAVHMRKKSKSVAAERRGSE